MAITPFADSPRNGGLGDRPYAIIDLAGPSSYNQVVPATANTTGLPTGGQPITPANFGLQTGLEYIGTSVGSSTGNYYVVAIQTTSYNQGFGNSTWTLQWVNALTGAQVAQGTNLSNEIVRLIAFGPY